MGHNGQGDDLDLREGPDEATRARLGDYALPAVRRWRRGPEAGSLVATTDDGDFSVRTATGAGATALRFEALVREHLGLHDYPVAPVLRTRRGDLHAPGSPSMLVHGPGSGAPGIDPANRHDLLLAGRVLARFHHVMSVFGPRLRPRSRPPLPALERNGPHLLATFSGLAQAHLNEAQQARLSRAGSLLWSQFIRVPESVVDASPGLPRVVNHGAFGPSAVHLSGDRCVEVRHLGAAGYDLRVEDVASALRSLIAWGGGTGAGDHEHGLDRAGSFLAGCGLSPAEAQALPALLRVGCLLDVRDATARMVAKPRSDPRPDEFSATVDLISDRADRLRRLDGWADVVGTVSVPR